MICYFALEFQIHSNLCSVVLILNDNLISNSHKVSVFPQVYAFSQFEIKVAFLQLLTFEEKLLMHDAISKVLEFLNGVDDFLFEVKYSVIQAQIFICLGLV